MRGKVDQDDPLAEDIIFIFDECKRIRKMGPEVIRLLPKGEFFFDLPHPSGQGKMLCGRVAAKRVDKLAEEAGRRGGLSRRVTRRTLRKATEELLIQRFITEGREPSRKQIDRFLASVGRKAKAACGDITHFVPCTLMTTQEPEALTVGPVIFRSRADFRRRMLQQMNTNRGGRVEERQRGGARTLLASAARFYRQFDWVAEVTVENCDPETSKLVAERAVTSALDCLHLIFQAQHSNKMRAGGPALRTDRRAGVTIGSDGKLRAHGSTSWAGEGGFPDGWSEQLKDTDLARMMGLIGLALEIAVDPDLVRPISRRFLDAAQWFGEATRDDRPATRVIKYVTALERMVMTDEMNDITKSVSERVAALCCESDGSNRQKWRDEATQIYDLRSRLVHGAMSPTDPRINSGVWLAARLGEATLLNALGALGEIALKDESVSTKRLAKWYRAVVAAIDKAEAATTGIADPTD